MIPKIKNIVFKTWFLALIISIPVIVLLPPIFNKYQVRTIEEGRLPLIDHFRYFHFDLDHDGYSEQVRSYYDNIEEIHTVRVFRPDGGIIDQWNFDGHPPYNIDSDILVIGDYDKDGLSEIFIFCELGDTIMLNCIEPGDTFSELNFRNKKLFVLSREYSTPDYSIHDPIFADINNDNYEDIIFTTHSGFAKFPRNVYMIDLHNNTVISSAKIGTGLGSLYLADLDQDNKFEITGFTCAAGNVHDSMKIPYNDYSAWVLVFDDDLSLLFEPIERPGFRSGFEVFPFINNKTNYIVAYYNHIGQNDNYPELMIIDGKGEIVKNYNFPKSDKKNRMLFLNETNKKLLFNIVDTDGKIISFNKDLEITGINELGRKISPGVYPTDLNKDSKPEFLFTTNNNELIIISDDFSYQVLLSFDSPINLQNMSLIDNGLKNRIFYIHNNKFYFILQYQFNPLYYLRFPVYLGIFCVLWLFILFVRKLQLIQIQKQNQIRSQIVNLQLKNFRNQMDPHFTFNVFNTMAHQFKNESPESYNAFMEFSNLIRKTLISSDSITRSIEDELSQLKSYLELEKLRFADKVQYTILVEKDVDKKIHIPKIILQTYVENAIKHGIQHKTDGGTVVIQIKKDTHAVLFEITDDGIGRQKAKELATDSTGFGLKIMDNYFRLFNEYNVSKIKHEIIDLYDKHNNPAGTRVRILIPLNFSYKLKKHGKA
ncbi:MAG: histidine kinase [Bacteroidetes bacterium]|nr:histidine kinase [Bacteroidota bacterium]